MGQLVYTAIASLDGFTADPDGAFDWAAPDAEVFAFVNDLEGAIGTYLYGRRMYETTVAWETLPAGADGAPETRDFAAIWRAASKVVFSRTLLEPRSARTRIASTFDVEAVRRLKQSSERALSVGGPTLAAQALRAGLVDEVRLFLTPVLVGGGTAALPDGLRLDLELLAERSFANGTVYLRYRTRA